ncbi:MAG: Na/Pi cotransporter family protein [Alcanivorax sp.]|nr:MAG: Na/Pi cotransporter family protein [Alcanivorax sp.]
MALTNLMQALAGLGLFLFAMAQLENAARTLLAGRAAGWLQQAAGTPVKGVLLGVAVTALMQSSSLVGLLVLALVTVRVLALRHAMGIMLGANLGTTMTGWLVTVLGFKLSLGEAGLPLAGLGGLLAIALPEGRRPLGRFVFALGLLLLGLDTMKIAVEVVGARFDLAVLQGLPPIVYLLVGVGLTALIQSSSASMLISLAALNGGLVSLPEALAFMIGADLGTTSTLLLGAVKGAAAKRQVAAFHLLYNVATALLAFLVLLPLWPRLLAALGWNDPLLGLVAFHSTFNLLGVFLFLPWLAPLERGLVRWVGRRARDPDPFEDVDPKAVEPALLVVEQGVARLGETIRRRCLDWPDRGALPAFYRDYEAITDREMRMTAYLNRVGQQPLDAGQTERLQRVRQRLSEWVYACKAIKDVVDDLAPLHDSRAPGLMSLDAALHRGLAAALADHPPLDEAAHGRAMARLTRQAYQEVDAARAEGISVLNLVREIDACGRHWIRGARAESAI